MKLLLGDCVERMEELDNSIIDLTVTSPPYDNLRTYKGYTFNFEKIAQELYRITKDGGVIVWVVADATVNGSETGTSFRQALYFKEIGFNLHDTMIWEKPTFTATGSLQCRYAPVFEYMFIFSKGKPKAFNPIMDRQSKFGRKISGNTRQPDGSTIPKVSRGKVCGGKLSQRFNVWRMNAETSIISVCHPAQFPEHLANDHIISWSNPGDIVLDPMMGSGTTGKMALLNHRDFIGIEISEEYFNIAKKRIEEATAQQRII